MRFNLNNTTNKVLSGQVLLSNALHMNSNKITNLATPTAATDAATKAYVDAAGGAPTMYLTSLTYQTNHNCDDVPSNCCDTGYHFCQTHEVAFGGRRIETTGTNRHPYPAATIGYADPLGNSLAEDCSDWTDNTTISGSGCSAICYDPQQGVCGYCLPIGTGGLFCEGYCYCYQAWRRLWCCSD